MKGDRIFAEMPVIALRRRKTSQKDDLIEFWPVLADWSEEVPGYLASLPPPHLAN